MKKILFSLSICALSLFGCSDSGEVTPTDSAPSITLTNQQNAFIANFTATWCGPCGSWGKPEITAMEAVNKDRVQVIDFHASNRGDNLYIVSAGTIAEAVNLKGFPTMLESFKTEIGSGAGAAIVNIRLGTTPEAQIGIAYVKKDASTYDVTVKTKFNVAKTPGYNVAVFVTEDNVTDRQAIGSTMNNTFVHKNIYRGFAGQPGEHLGRSLTSNSINANQEFVQTFTYKVPSAVIKRPDMKFTAVLLEMNAGGTGPARSLNSARVAVTE